MKILKAIGLLLVGAIGGLVAYKESDKVKEKVDKASDAIHKGVKDAKDKINKKEEKPEEKNAETAE